MMQTTGVARFVDLKLETQRITLIADAQFADSKTKKIRTKTKKIRKRFIMSAEIFKMIADVGLIVFLNCVIAGIFDLFLGAFFLDSGDMDKEEVAEKCIILIIVIAAIALITALDGALLYSAFSNK